MDEDPRGPAAPGAPLRQLLVAVGEPLIDLLAAPAGLDVDVRDVVIAEPDEDAAANPGDLVLVIGARGRSALRQVRSAARDGAAAVAVKTQAEQDAAVLRDAALDAGIALFGVWPEVRWEQLESLVRTVVDNARLTVEADAGEAPGDLFALAQTVAAMTGGSVSIEDTASRVLAYSRSDDEVDELRRLSILGRRGPEPYLAMLREWGVYERLRSGEEVVGVDERPDLGIRRRMAVGIHAGAQPLGTIWVQEGSRPLEERSQRALLGAARVAAVQLIRQRAEASAAPRLRENLLIGLLDGKVDAASVAGNIGADASRPAVVVVFALRGRAGVSNRPELELERAEMTGLISVHAAAYRRSALVTTLGSRVYVLLPDLPVHALPGVLGMTREIAAAAGQQLRAAVQAGVGSVVAGLDEVPHSRAEADRVLDAMGHDLDAPIATIADVRSRVVLSELLTVLGGNERFRDPRLDALFAHDAEHSGALARSVLAYLEHFGDVRSASAALHVHPNTLRHRIRRAGEITGIDLADPAERLTTQLHLLLHRRQGR
ncbi:MULTISPECIES: CdaR family transcriptional regulator [unclassified Saccharopolyspora]|uniref:PucR family transcriptional regulator n=1 Tax=unclassified Saccharopolyspora TaxID=2646250 RepID=UPI001CD5780E|nr:MULTISPECIES: helix-turn-helix domain-containing protein [unclassified Saccharopolyspora]MCA1188433.1 helix-turn-helix domain-containing protein [Saccharopolyspora sp. 6T]MCA1192760.1 helix-turn-helix domain-containing protein [Saccharopolyspora sp. 6V]MCA1225376.1 helix-turn-helix domain-containing protein [Saccharopolyspora sp. 6M]MCA1279476.1 helix-turn-helix domain-containing protein [Saccharopolyspora sp. 7B]